MTRMGSLLQVHPTSVTSAVDRLEKQGYVERRARSEDDRRVVLASITDAGRDVVERATAGLNARRSSRRRASPWTDVRPADRAPRRAAGRPPGDHVGDPTA